MSEQKISRSTTFMTPRFHALWSHLDKPDKPPQSERLVYSVTAQVDPSNPEVAAFLEQLDGFGEQALAYAREQIEKSEGNPAKRARKLEGLVLHPVYEPEYDKDGMETGKVLFKLKTYATRKDKNGNEEQTTVNMCDAHRHPIDATQIAIGNGSILRVGGTVRPNYVSGTNKAFATLYIGAVQLIDLVEYTGAGFDRFAEEETSGEADFKKESPIGGSENGDF